MTPIKLNFEHLQKRIADNPEVAKSLAEVGLDDAYALLSTYLFSNDKIDLLLEKDHPTVTDDRPRLEYYLPHSGAALYASQLEKFRSDPRELFSGELLDLDSMRKSQQAMTYLRLAEQTFKRDHDRVKAHAFAQQALDLFPENKFFKFALTNQYALPSIKTRSN